MKRRGLDNVKMIWHWANSDPELEYNWIVANYWTIEDTLYEQWKEDIDEEDYQKLNENQKDIMFNQWLKDNPHLIDEVFDNYKDFYS
jgi:hypothetical protein